MLCVDRSGDGSAEDKAALLLQADESIPPASLIRSKIRSCYGYEPPTIGQPRQSRSNMADSRVSNSARIIGDGREWRVHQQDRGDDRRLEVIVDLCSVEAGDGKSRKEGVKQLRAGTGHLVQHQPAAGNLGQDRH